VPEIKGAVANFGAGLDQDDAFVISRHVPPSYLETSPYKLVDTQNRHALFAVSKNTRQGLVGEREMELAALLLPHLRRAVMISDVLHLRAIFAKTGVARQVDLVRLGAGVVPPSGISEKREQP
jgi:hypothetical protein